MNERDPPMLRTLAWLPMDNTDALLPIDSREPKLPTLNIDAALATLSKPAQLNTDHLLSELSTDRRAGDVDFAGDLSAVRCIRIPPSKNVQGQDQRRSPRALGYKEL